MFPPAENIGFWIFVALLCVGAWGLMRWGVRRQMAAAPTGSLRTPMHQWLHRSSLLAVVLPLGYVFLVDGSWFWEALAILWVQAAAMLLLRVARVRFKTRLVLLAPVSVISVIIGAVVSVWPDIDFASIRIAPWPFLSVVGLAFAISHFLSMWSWPAGAGERAF